MGEYANRVAALIKTYKVLEKNNNTFKETHRELEKIEAKLGYVRGLGGALSVLERLIIQQQAEWQDSILRMLESEISEALATVYPEDGYTVSLTARLVRGKIHVEGSVKAYFMAEFPGAISDSQGRLFQQIVSFAALMVVMRILQVNTVYVDEAFSGASMDNASRVNRLLKVYASRGANLIIIAQNGEIADGIPANVLNLERSVDNITSVTQRSVRENDE